MSEQRDIVDRLRDGCPGCKRMECKAADEIESLRAEIARLRESLCSLLARSSPPEVVLPAPPFDPSNVAYSDWMMCLSAVRSYLAAAGVTVKEVGSE
jgi:hypothetical protein